jgi:hypothetical protein
MTTAVKDVITYQGNAEIDSRVENISKLWHKGEKDRLTIGKYFSELKAETKPYKQDSGSGLSYTSAVKLTGVPRATAELYRQMYEATQLGNGRQIPAKVFLGLSEAGFNLHSNLGDGVMVEGIVHDHPEILSGEIDDYEKLAEILNMEYGKKKAEDNTDNVVDMEKELAGLKEQATKASGLLKNAAVKVIEEMESEIHSHRLSALASLATALAPFLGKRKEWAKQYSGEISDSRTLTAQRYREAVKFAQSLTAQMAGGE